MVGHKNGTHGIDSNKFFRLEQSKKDIQARKKSQVEAVIRLALMS
jgi:hypothetical protein